MIKDFRPFAVALCAFCAFLNLWAPQAMLPELAREFNVSAAAISAVMTSGTLAIALAAPFAGAIADVLGRKRVITVAMAISTLPGVLIALAPDVPTIIVYRFLQGLFLPPIFTVIVAYVGDEWPPKEAAGVVGYYVLGASFGGFSGRLIPGVVADIAGWQAGFAALAAITFAATVVIALILPREKHFVRSAGIGVALKQMISHFANPKLVATYAVGFGLLFNFVATFTYIGFRLAAPPYNLSNTALGTLFATYLVGTFSSPMIGRGIAVLGRRGLIFALLAGWAVGILLLLAPHLPIIILGLVLCAGCGLLCQGLSTGYVTTTATEGRSSAVGLYFTSFYIGGTLGGFLPGLTWERLGWPMVVAEVLVMLAMMAAMVAAAWPAAQAPK